MPRRATRGRRAEHDAGWRVRRADAVCLYRWVSIRIGPSLVLWFPFPPPRPSLRSGTTFRFSSLLHVHSRRCVRKPRDCFLPVASNALALATTPLPACPPDLPHRCPGGACAQDPIDCLPFTPSCPLGTHRCPQTGRCVPTPAVAPTCPAYARCPTACAVELVRTAIEEGRLAVPWTANTASASDAPATVTLSSGWWATPALLEALNGSTGCAESCGGSPTVVLCADGSCADARDPNMPHYCAPAWGCSAITATCSDGRCAPVSTDGTAPACADLASAAPAIVAALRRQPAIYVTTATVQWSNDATSSTYVATTRDVVVERRALVGRNTAQRLSPAAACPRTAPARCHDGTCARLPSLCPTPPALLAVRPVVLGVAPWALRRHAPSARAGAGPLQYPLAAPYPAIMSTAGNATVLRGFEGGPGGGLRQLGPAGAWIELVAAVPGDEGRAPAAVVGWAQLFDSAATQGCGAVTLRPVARAEYAGALQPPEWAEWGGVDYALLSPPLRAHFDWAPDTAPTRPLWGDRPPPAPAPPACTASADGLAQLNTTTGTWWCNGSDTAVEGPKDYADLVALPAACASALRVDFVLPALPPDVAPESLCLAYVQPGAPPAWQPYRCGMGVAHSWASAAGLPEANEPAWATTLAAGGLRGLRLTGITAPPYQVRSST